MELLSTKLVFENDGTTTDEVIFRVRIQSQAGLQAFGLIRLPYASALSNLEILYVRVTKPDHRVVETPAENFLEMPADITRQAPFYSDLKEKQIAVKGLAIGDTLEISRHEHLYKPVDPGQFWFSYNFLQAGIVLDESLEIAVPRERPVKVESEKVQPTLTERGAYKVYTWKTAQLQRKSEIGETKPPDPDEPDRASVQITSYKDWNEFGQWFHGLAAPRAIVTSEIQQRANELTRNAKTESEKIQILYRFVAGNFRYISISLGIGRYQPHSAADVLGNDYGDCKDKHTLFAALLAAAGVKAYPALISSSQNIDPDFPLPSQMDHVITALPQDKGFLFLDTTSEVAPFGYLGAELRDKRALVVPDAGPAQLAKTPADPPFESFFRFHSDGTLDETGTLQSKMQFDLRGDPEISYRAAFRSAGQPEWKDVMQKISSNFGYGGTVSDVTLSPIDDTNSPFRIEYNYNRKNYSDWENRQFTPPCPPIFLPHIAEDAGTAKYPKPLHLGTPFTYRFSGTLRLPSNSHLHLLPSLDLHESFADFRSIYSFSEGVLHYERVLTSKAREVTPAQFDAYRRFLKAVEDDATTYFTLREDESASADTSDNPAAQEYYRLGGEAWRRNDMAGAARLFQQALDKDPNFAGPMFWLGAAHVASGRPDQGLEEMKKSLSLNPNQQGNYRYLCGLLASHHREEEALDYWKQLRKLNPDRTEASEGIVRILLQLQRYSEAVTELEAQISRAPDVPGLRLQLGIAYVSFGKPAEAAAAFKKALELDSSANNLNSVAYVFAENKIQLDEALKLAQLAVSEVEEKSATVSLGNLLPEDVQIAPKLAAYWDTLGWVFFQATHFELAEKYLRAAWNLGQDPIIGDHLGQTLEKLGKKHEALLAYSEAIAAGRAGPELLGRRDYLQKGANYSSAKDRTFTSLQEQRSYKLGRLASKHATAEFYVLIKSGARTIDVAFISGSEELRSADKAIQSLKFGATFPNGAEAQILRRGILDCEPELSYCVFVLIPPASVQFTKLPDPQ
ncbi:MAG: DUF3857 domain-containing protein [Candidatus Acidiferrales bacterium]